MSCALRIRVALPIALVAALSALAAPASAGDVSAAELARVRYELSKIDDQLRNAAGLPIELSKHDKKAFRLVQELAKANPDDAGVQELVAEAKEIYRRTKGQRFEITPEMLAYRQRKQSLADVVAKASAERWKVLCEELLADESYLHQPFPAQMPPDVDPTEVEGRLVILRDVPYEQALFVQSGVNRIAAGEPSRGFYWIDGSGPSFVRLFEALSRYRRGVQQLVPDAWHFVCRIREPDLLAPESSSDRAGSSYFGWGAEPVALYVPGAVLVELGNGEQEDATFAGQDQTTDNARYTVTSVPEDVDPEGLVRIYVAALKEKNFDLHLECFDPSQRKTSHQVQGLRYNWEVQQKGLERLHAHAEPFEVAPVQVVSGGKDEELESFFGEGEDLPPATTRKEERVKVTVRLFDARGVQTVRPRYVTLVRVNGGRWGILSGGTLTF